MREVPLKTGRIAPWRRGVQWLATLLVLGLPFIRPGGESLLRLDAGTRTLLFFGAKLRIEEFHLFLIVVLILVFAFLFVTMLFGRVWCGWLCPQTTLGDLADWIERRTRNLPAPLRAALRQSCFLTLSALVGANLVWYFIAPPEFFVRLTAGNLGAVAGISLAVTALVVYLDLAFVRRRFCKSVCPYGRIQLMTMERGTLTLEFDPELKGVCLRCGACVKACPTGIDIREGLQIECINCGRCLDACRDVFAKRGRGGLIHYTFGPVGADGSRPVNRKALLLGGVLLLLVGLLVFGVTTRQEATLKVQRAASGEVKRLPDGSLVNFYSAFLENRGSASRTFSLEAAPLPGYRVELVGPVRGLELAGNANRKIGFALKVSPAPAPGTQVELKLVSNGKVVAASPLPVAVQ
ncbi:4Fe-4S dicluster domain-containing protein [Geomonas azotofigens]|uniref:4Fe-4S dicluster domain-containing protein n=1 Tax=Geomonas azotofigens TaxID=2843196 RepID=UPI001C0FE100|nr:4Fe-4S dicluster domain-containing protein [Geomonas azotofigens]MBU5615452.1 4Fe-4S binding protein [Geomonas azotofigens]